MTQMAPLMQAKAEGLVLHSKLFRKRSLCNIFEENLAFLYVVCETHLMQKRDFFIGLPSSLGNVLSQTVYILIL